MNKLNSSTILIIMLSVVVVVVVVGDFILNVFNTSNKSNENGLDKTMSSDNLFYSNESNVTQISSYESKSKSFNMSNYTLASNIQMNELLSHEFQTVNDQLD